MKDIIEKYAHSVEFIDLKVVDIHGRLRHVTLPGNRLNETLFKEGVGFDASNFGFASVESSDMIMIPDPDTAFIDPFYDAKTLSLFCDVFLADTFEPFDQYPRNVLKNAIKKLEEVGVKDAMMAPELEFHIFESFGYNVDTNGSFYEVDVSEGFWNSREFSNRYIIDKKRGYHRTPPADSYSNFRNEVVKVMLEIGIPVKYHHHEVSSAQHEIELLFQKALKAADSIIIVKYIIQNIAEKHGLAVTFMPKPLYNEAGNGLHVHQFLIDQNKNNIFSGDEYSGLSQIALYYLAGILKHSLSGSLLAFTNPSTNSYKRLVPGFEAPVCATFAKANRSAAIRIPGYIKNPEKVRIEFRTMDASCNPYYSLSAILLAGINGIKQRFDPKEMGFGPLEKNIYEMADNEREKIRFFPTSLEAVLEGLIKDNEYLNEIFSKNLIVNWYTLKKREAEYVNSVPSPAEYQLYFDL
ncbi:glutamine synthetase [Kosmotoga arenicorallina S304]|uniref:Glutamine synthetase n=1 Tax=Kosmotoga arenicorallina S304 TaxID=1453497 RepID=A0A176K0Q0_9BACT|nr:type I glutamate--ammonia ligase [Kosmotoga arenicorallina]OAA29755.1 glutamine synthetase [Kosmotoga arenicorallina S304]